MSSLLEQKQTASINAGNYGQDSHEAWLERRRQSIGGSDAAAIAGTTPYANWYTLWCDKTGRLKKQDNPILLEAAWVGTQLEPAVVDRFAQETGYKVTFRDETITNKKYPYSHANVDGWLPDFNEGLEIKTCSPTFEGMMKEAKDTGSFPLKYYCQCLHYMAITEADGWWLAVLVLQKGFYIFHISREDVQEDIDTLMEDERFFWEEFVLKDVPPQIDGSEASKEALSLLFPKARDNSKMDLVGFDSMIEEYFSICEEEKALKTRKEEIANKIKAEMGDNETGVSSKFTVTWKNSSPRKTFNEEMFKEENPDIDLDKYYTGKPSSRRFGIKKNS